MRKIDTNTVVGVFVCALMVSGIISMLLIPEVSSYTAEPVDSDTTLDVAVQEETGRMTAVVGFENESIETVLLLNSDGVVVGERRYRPSVRKVTLTNDRQYELPGTFTVLAIDSDGNPVSRAEYSLKKHHAWDGWV